VDVVSRTTRKVGESYGGRRDRGRKMGGRRGIARLKKGAEGRRRQEEDGVHKVDLVFQQVTNQKKANFSENQGERGKSGRGTQFPPWGETRYGNNRRRGLKMNLEIKVGKED